MTKSELRDKLDHDLYPFLKIAAETDGDVLALLPVLTDLANYVRQYANTLAEERVKEARIDELTTLVQSIPRARMPEGIDYLIGQRVDALRKGDK